MNNNLYFNAALAGCLGGTEQRATSGADATALAAAVAFATQVDSAIPFDAAVTTANNNPVALASAGSDNVAISKCGLLRMLCAANMAGRYPTSAVAATYAPNATAIAAQFAAGVAQMVIP